MSFMLKITCFVHLPTLRCFKMRQLLYILISLTAGDFCSFGQHIYGQTKDSTSILTDRLYTEISSSYYVEYDHVGCYGAASMLYPKVDSLKTIVGLKSFIEYFNDSSANLKYYAFIEMLTLDDSLAFEKLKTISQSSDSISFNFPGQYRGEARLIELLTGEYIVYIKCKYYYGGNGIFHGRECSSCEKNKRTWRKKKKILYKFLISNGLSKDWIEKFYR